MGGYIKGGTSLDPSGLGDMLQGTYDPDGDGVIGIANGGTDAQTAPDARANLGAAESGANTDITSLMGLTTALGVSYGGSGADNVAEARINLGLGVIEAENKEGSSISVGMAVATHSSGTGVIKASAADNSKPCVGLLMETTANGVSGHVQMDGVVTLGNWSAVTGSASLVKGKYFLDPSTPGRLTNSAPTISGQVVQVVGYAVSATDLQLSISSSILL